MSVIYDVIDHVPLYSTRHSHVDVTCAGQREAGLSEGQGRPIRALSGGLQIPWSKSRDMTSWARGGALERRWPGRVVTWDEHDRSSGSRGVT